MQYLGRARKNTTAADNTGTQDTVKKEEGSVVPLIAELCALLLLIGSVTLAITGAHVQTQRLTDFADAQASAVARTARQLGEQHCLLLSSPCPGCQYCQQR